MPIRTIGEIASYWTAEGGAPGQVTTAVAVALAESAGDDHAISPSYDFGLWQINQVHQFDPGIEWPDILDQWVNARAAIAISGNGSNWRDWATCYAPPAPPPWVSYLAAPQRGSPAYGLLATVAEALGTAAPAPVAPAPPPLVEGPSSGRAGVEDGWRSFQDWHNAVAPSYAIRLSNLTQRMKGLSQL